MSGYRKTFLLIGLAGIFIFLNETTSFPDSQAEKSKFAKADKAFLKRADRNSAFQALSLYKKIYNASPNDPEAAWRLSMACYFVGFNLLGDQNERKKIYAQGRDAGLAAVRISTGSAEAHFWTAVNMALYGQTVGVIKMLFTLNTVREHLRMSSEINPKYAYGGAYRILGKIDETLPPLLGGNKDMARQYYEKAIENAPDEPTNYFFLAKLLFNEYNNKNTALEFANKGLSIRNLEPFRFESFESQGELKKFLKICSEKKD